MVGALSTEEKILEAAEAIFIKDGYDGARMQDIADRAEINKAMLHYYFRSKDQLFERVFNEKAKFFFPEIAGVFSKDNTFIEKMEEFVELYIHFINQYPFIPFFIIRTINTSGKESFIEKLPFKDSLAPPIFNSYFQDSQKGLVAEINPLQFVLSVIGMCIFPFLGRPILQHAFDLKPEQFTELMELRINELKIYIRKILTP